MVHLLSISELRTEAQRGRTAARVHGQIYSLVQKETQQRKPYWELILADAESRFPLRAWSDSPAYKQCLELQQGAFVEVTGEFESSLNFGLDAKSWACRPLDPDEVESLLAGPKSLRDKQARDYEYIVECVSRIADPRLGAVCAMFLEELGERFRRTAAARNNHHARRGGLVEHTAQMMRASEALCPAYPMLNHDLMTAGVLLHDSGKLWENSLPADGFVMPYDERGELMGHIAIGMELTNRLWRQLEKLPGYEQWKTMSPRTDDIRLHLTHLILSHHGELQYGSPVAPKTPEAFALHYLDNLDAKMEMVSAAYQNANLLAPRIYEKAWPLPTNLVAPLPAWTPDPPPAA
ncbi:MAG: HD domain-containing protein [Chthoniobacteraceae bacterium]|jgi:3'-5' exoribonuclease